MKSIILNIEEVGAILEGRKTQKRVVMKVQPPSPDYTITTVMSSIHRKDEGKHQWMRLEGYDIIDGTQPYFKNPFAVERLWVREPFALGLCTKSGFAYKATHRPKDLEEGWFDEIKWSPAVHMPYWARRLELDVTDIRVERLQDISEEDAREEGMYWVRESMHDPAGLPAKLSFERKWRKDIWEKNPFVWVIKFKVVKNEA